MMRRPLLYLLLLMLSTGIVKAEKAVLKPPGQFTYRQKKELDMGSKLMQARRAAEPFAREHYEEFKKRSVFGAGTYSPNINKSNPENDVVPLKVDPTAILGEGNRFPSEIYYCEGGCSMGGFIFEDDSAAVWYRPLTEAYFTGLGMYFYYETEMIGTDVTLYLRDVLDDPIPDDWTQDIPGNGEYDFTIYNEGIAHFLGDVLWEYTFPLTESDVYPNWFEVEIPEADWVDVGTRDFAITLFISGGDNADLMYYAGVNGSGIPYNHGIKWYHTGAGYCAPNPCWVPRLNFVIHAYVDYYGDPPPFIWSVEDLDDVYESCDPGPYEATAVIQDVGTNVFDGALTEVLFIYDDGSGPDTLDVTYQNDPTIGGTFTGTIPSLGAGSTVEYWWSATDNGAENPDGDVAHTTDLQFESLRFAIHESSGANILFINDSGSDDDYMWPFQQFMDEVGYLSDKWITYNMGVPGECELGYYGLLIVGQGLNGYGSIAPESDFEAHLMAHMDSGGTFVLISDDYIHGLGLPGDVWTSVDASVNPFLADYLHVDSYCSDCSADSLYAGIDGTVSEGLGEFEAHPAWPDQVIPDDDAIPLFDVWSYDEQDWESVGGIQYGGDYHMIFVPWDMDKVDDPNILIDFAANLLLNIPPPPQSILIPIERPRWAVPAGTYDLEFEYEVFSYPDIASQVDLHIVIDGDYQVHSMSNDDGDETWNVVLENVNVSISETDTSIGTFKAIAYQGTILSGASIEDGYYAVDWEGTDAPIMYIIDAYEPYWDYGVGFHDSTMKANMDAAGINYDIWSNWDNGLPDFQTVLSNYAGVINNGVLDWVDWAPQSADNTLAEFVNKGGYLLYSSEEKLGTLSGWEDVNFYPGDFAYDVLGVDYVYNDWGYTHVVGNDDGGTGLLDGGLDTIYVELDSMAHYWGTAFVDMMVPTNEVYGFPFLAEYAPGSFYYASSIVGNTFFTAFNIPMMPTDFQRQLLFNFGGHIGPSVEDEEPLPLEFALHQNYPNPFNTSTTIRFDLPENTDVELVIYDILGRKVETLLPHPSGMIGQLVGGPHEVVWEASTVASGIYIYRLTAGEKQFTRKLILLK